MMQTEAGTLANWLIVGLGNPGLQYERTRHNLGFMVVDRLARLAQAQIKRAECNSLIGRAYFNGEVVELAKPQTFMNLSGESVACLLKKSDRAIERTIIVSDDLALPFGRIRIRPKGSHGGHNGLRSIIERTSRDDFIRLRIGIMPDHPLSNTRDFVLQNFSKTETAELEDILKKGVEATLAVVSDGIEKAMADFN